MELAVVLPVNIYITASHTSWVSQMKCCLDNKRRWPFRYVLFVWNKKRPFVIFVNLWSIELLPSERWSQPAIRTEMLMEGDFFNGDGFFQECFSGARFFNDVWWRDSMFHVQIFSALFFKISQLRKIIGSSILSRNNQKISSTISIDQFIALRPRERVENVILVIFFI